MRRIIVVFVSLVLLLGGLILQWPTVWGRCPVEYPRGAHRTCAATEPTGDGTGRGRAGL